MSLFLHNTATRNIEAFTPLTDNVVRVYTCGPTVYDSPHIGNWVAYIYWDTLIRTLLSNGCSVERVMNITDVGHLVSDGDDGEDKLEKGARREGKTAWEIAEFYAEDFLKGMEKLGLIMPEHIARATDFIPEQLDLVRTLKRKGCTYQTSDGIYFDTSKFERYADFARLDLDELKAGARVDVNPEKRNPSDFALWKFSPRNAKRDMEWETPGDLIENTEPPTGSSVMGFPGWHLECSAIAMRLLGETLDIHTGGIDHIPIHHTNEIAQSEAATGNRFSNYWLHNNHLKVDGTKISKSLSNGYTLQDLEMRGFDALDFRLFVLQSHYQNEGNFTFDSLKAAKNRRLHWRAVAALRWQAPAHSNDTHTETENVLVAAIRSVKAALNDNLNTPEALRVIDEAFSRLDSVPLSGVPAEALTDLLITIDELLGLQLLESTPNISEETKQLISQRELARDNRDWQSSDSLRKDLEVSGIAIRDTADGSIWSYVD